VRQEVFFFEKKKQKTFSIGAGRLKRARVLAT
jgi:hypothetical protein